MAFEEFYRLGLAFFGVFSWISLFYVFDVLNYESKGLKTITQLVIGVGIIIMGFCL